MATNRTYPAGQATGAEYAFHQWMTLYYDAYMTTASPQLRTMGLLEEAPTPGRNYHVSIPPLGTGDTVEQEDGQEWPAAFMQGAEVVGKVRKRGPRGLNFTEDDLLEDKLPLANANVTALGRAEKLFEDKEAARAMEAAIAGTDPVTKLPIVGHDNQPIFSAAHPIDPVKGNGTQTNLFTLALTPDNLLTVISNFRSLKTESNDPIFTEEAGFCLVVPPSQMANAEKCLDRQIIAEAVGSNAAGSVTNLMYKRAGLCVLPQLTDTGRWYVAINNMMRKPILRVVFRSLLRFQLGPESDEWKKRQMMKIYSNEKTDYRLVDWRLIAASKGQ